MYRGAITLTGARRLAGQHGYEEIYFNETSRVVSFKSYEVRVNVYYTTGTVGTCLEHPSQGHTQLFGRNVTLDGLGAILDNPRIHTGARYHTRDQAPDGKRRKGANGGGGSGGGGSGGGGGGGGGGGHTAAVAEEAALLAHAKALDESIQELQSQRSDTMAGLAVFEKRRADERAAEEEVARQAAAEVARQAAVAEGQRVEALRQAEAQQENERRRQRGNQTSFWLQENDHVDTIWCAQTTQPR